MECEASSINTATPQENQKLETRYVGAEKRAFRAHFGHVIKQVGMSQRPPATCLETFEKEDVL